MPPNSRDITAPIAGDIVTVLDFMSRVISAGDNGNGSYMHDKVGELGQAVRRLLRRLSEDPPPNLDEPMVWDPSKRFDPSRLRDLVARDAHHYLAGRRLYPANGDPYAAERRRALEDAATELMFESAIAGLTPVLADAVAGWLRERAKEQQRAR